MFGQGFNSGFFGGPPCFTDTTDIFKDNSGVALYTLDYDASSGEDITTNTLQILGDTSCFAAYPLDGSSADLSGNYNGTDTSVTYTSGYFDQSASFNGSSSFITLPGSMLNSRTAISASAWVYRRTGSSDAYEYVIAGGDNVSGGRYGIAVNDAGSGSADNKFYLSDGASSMHTNTICAYNTWYHVVLTWAGTEMKFYVNGSLDSTFTVASCNFQSSGNGHKIGEYFYNGTYEWEGEIDQVRLFNKAISASEVTILYNEIGRRDGTPTNVDFGVGGKSLYGARFNGSNSAIIVPNNILASNNHSVSMWFYLDDTTGTQTLIEFDYGNRIIFRVASTDSNWAYIGSSGYFNHGISFSAGQWYHLAITFSAGSPFKIYVNGNLSYTGGNTNLYLRTADNIIGAGNSSGANCVDGAIDQVRLFNKALSAAEISKLYGGGAGEIACTYTSTTDNVAYPIANTAYYKLDNNSKDLARSTGKFNEGAILNGSSTSISTTNNTNFPLTFSFWVKPNNTSVAVGMLISKRSGTSGISITGEPDGDMKILDLGGAGSTGFITQGLSFGTWHHVVVIITTSGWSSYVNGVAAGTSSTAIASNTYSVRIGHLTVGNWAGAAWGIDQLRIFNKAISSSEVTTLYSETKNTTNTLQILGDSSCIATYQLDGNSTDLSGNYNGTDTNITYAYDGTESNVEYRFGRFGQAAVFNGSSKIDIDNVIPTDLNASLSMWVKSSEMNLNNTTVKTIFYNRNPYFIIYRYAGNWLFVIKNSSSTNYTVSCPVSNFNNNQWYHFAATCDGLSGTMNFYVNGISVGTTSSPSSILNVAASAFIGSGANAQYFNGSIDQIRAYSTTLTDSQVTELYNEKPEVDTSNFKTVLYEGTSSEQYISNVGFDLDVDNGGDGGFVWVKARTGTARDSRNYDTVRGIYPLYSSRTLAEGTVFPIEYDANGFFFNGNEGGVNETGVDYVAWVWKGGGDAVTGTGSGVTNVSVSTNTDAGFSIVKYTGGNSVSNTVNHGLTDAEIIILKDLTDGTNHWRVWHKDLTSGYWLYLSLPNAQANAATDGGIRNVDSNSFGFINGTTQGIEGVNSSASNYIAYVWKSIAGYSKIGTYEGTNSTVTVSDVGFKPSFVMIKNVDDSADWVMLDNSRNTIDDRLNNWLRANSAAIETGAVATAYITVNDSGFIVANATSLGTNANGDTYIYMAFK